MELNTRGKKSDLPVILIAFIFLLALIGCWAGLLLYVESRSVFCDSEGEIRTTDLEVCDRYDGVPVAHCTGTHPDVRHEVCTKGIWEGYNP